MVRKEIQYIDISDIPELVRLAEEVQATQEPRMLKKGDQVLAELRPARINRKKKVQSGVITYDDPLWKLVGSATEAAPSDASKKYEYLADQTP